VGRGEVGVVELKGEGEEGGMAERMVGIGRKGRNGEES